jgi:hypothetical protein
VSPVSLAHCVRPLNACSHRHARHARPRAVRVAHASRQPGPSTPFRRLPRVNVPRSCTSTSSPRRARARRGVRSRRTARGRSARRARTTPTSSRSARPCSRAASRTRSGPGAGTASSSHACASSRTCSSRRRSECAQRGGAMDPNNGLGRLKLKHECICRHMLECDVDQLLFYVSLSAKSGSLHTSRNSPPRLATSSQ